MGLIDSMKERIKNSGSSRKEIFYVGADAKKRVRFLQELDDGFEFKFHLHWNRGVNALCAEQYGGDCPYCAETDEEMKEITMYVWNVWDYDANAVRVLLYKATGITPVPQMIEFSEEYGTVCDRDYTIKKTGKGVGSSITVIPSEVSKFRNSKAKPFNYKQIIKLLQAAYPINEEDSSKEDDEDERPAKAKAKGKAQEKKNKKREKTIEEKLQELNLSDLRDIAIEIGISKKELKGLDEEELVELLIDDYEEEDLEEAYEDFVDAQDEDEEDDE